MKNLKIKLFSLLINFLLISPALAEQCGIASWYEHGTRTASGERFNPEAMTAAHRTLPFGTMVAVRDPKTGHHITVRINDRGPFIAGRIIDLSRAAMHALKRTGLVYVCVEPISKKVAKISR